MPQATRRLARATKLVRAYIQHRKACQIRLARRIAFLKQQASQENESAQEPLFALDSLSELSAATSLTNSIPDSETTTSSSLGSWSSSESATESWMSNSETSGSDPDAEEAMPSLLSMENGAWDSDDEDSDGGDGISDIEADDEESDSDEEEVARPSPRQWVQTTIKEMYAHRYEVPRNKLPQGPAYMRHVLTVQKDYRPDHFRQSLRVSPVTFDKIVAKISDDPVFFNESNMPQQPIEDQLAIALFRFGHYGNSASLQNVANWAGVGKGTVTIATRRVMTAVLRPHFIQESIRFPTAEEKEEAKVWVETHSCKAWRNGWCLVDGTLIPLYARPFWYGESYFDQKCNYSLNIQVMTICSLQLGWAEVCQIDRVTTKSTNHRFRLWSHGQYS